MVARIYFVIDADSNQHAPRARSASLLGSSVLSTAEDAAASGGTNRNERRRGPRINNAAAATQAPRRSYCFDLLAAATADSTLDTRNKTGTCPRSAQLLSFNHQIPIISRGTQEVDTCSHPHPCTNYFDAEFTKSSGAARMMPWSNSSPAEWAARRDARLTAPANAPAPFPSCEENAENVCSQNERQ